MKEFKFIVADWLTGRIVAEEFDVQGLYVNICALYCKNAGNLTIDEINLRYKNPPQLNALLGKFIFLIEENHVSIKFLDEQISQKKHIKSILSDSGKKSATLKANKTNQNSTYLEPTLNLPSTHLEPTLNPPSTHLQPTLNPPSTDLEPIIATITTISTTIPTIAKKRNKLTIEDKPEFIACRNYWLENVHPDFTFTATHARQLKSIISKIKVVVKKKGNPITETTAIDTFVKICSSLPEWYKNKDLSIIDSKFNELLEEIRSASLKNNVIPTKSQTNIINMTEGHNAIMEMARTKNEQSETKQ